ncbi:hypothetical protein pb186bvf_019506 [Paramecium bursaria]
MIYNIFILFVFKFINYIQNMQSLINDKSSMKDEDYDKFRMLLTILGQRDRAILDMLQIRSNQCQLYSNEFFILKIMKALVAVQKPSSAFRVFWDLMNMVFIFGQMIYIPLVLCYSIDQNTFIYVLNQMISAYFMIDIVLTFNLAIYEKYAILLLRGELIYDRKLIAKEYLRGWLWIDIISALPYDDLDITSDPNLVSFFRFFKFVKILRLLRILKLKRLFTMLEQQLSLGVGFMIALQFLKIAILILSLCHWIACIWNIIEMQQEFAQESWMVNYGVDNVDWDIKYLAAIYYSVTTMVTIGYGDIHSYTTTEMTFSIFTMIVASGVFGYSMASIMSTIENDDAQVIELKSQNTKILKYIKQKNVTKNLQGRVRNYLEWLAGSEQIARNHELQVLNNLSSNLKTEIINLLNTRILSGIKIIESQFSQILLRKIVFILKERIQGPEEYVFVENQIDDDKFYYIGNGKVAITIGPKNTQLATLTKGDYFGEIGFFSRLPRTASAKTYDFVNLTYLQREDLWDAAQQTDADIEKLLSIRNSLEIENDLRPLKMRCYICEKPHHIARNCSDVHFQKRRIKIINQYLEEKNYRIRKFQRRINKTQQWQLLKNKVSISSSEILKRTSIIRIYNNFPLTSIKNSFEIDVPKDYSNYHPDYNLSKIISDWNQSVEVNIQSYRELRMKSIHRKQRQAVKQTKLIVPFNSNYHYENDESIQSSISDNTSTENLIKKPQKRGRLMNIPSRVRPFKQIPLSNLNQKQRTLSLNNQRMDLKLYHLKNGNYRQLILTYF